ncbi:MAG: hypothetical protein IH914_04585 [candidate division Zixibacteria bacterium]|nr:hypothetical protein [candidate division Zixibacteria bacterium]
MMKNQTENPRLRIEVIEGDATFIEADVLALKYAQTHYGLDIFVADRLCKAGYSEDAMRPKSGEYRLHPGVPGVATKSILFVGVNPLWAFDYHQIRVFARRVLSTLARELPNTQSLVVTVHGPGYGLDEDEAFESQLAGFLEAVDSSNAPDRLEVITFAERNKGRASRLRKTLESIVPSSMSFKQDSGLFEGAESEMRERLRAAGYASASKNHVFVAMPFSEEFDDVYHYGIQNAVNSAGLLCERVDISSFTGDVVDRVKKRIRSASLVVADLSGANPNVFLEVGFAWGCGVPTVLLAKDSTELRFDVQGQRCLIYKKIKELEEKLSTELVKLNVKDRS